MDRAEGTRHATGSLKIKLLRRWRLDFWGDEVGQSLFTLDVVDNKAVDA